MSITSVTPSTRSRMMRSMPAFSVWVEAGHHTRPGQGDGDDAGLSLTSRRMMSPPSACSAGRITSIVFSTWSRIISGWAGVPFNHAHTLHA